MPAGNVIGRNNALFLDNVLAPVPKLPLGTGGAKQNEGDKVGGGIGGGIGGIHSRLSKTTELGTATSTPSPTRMVSAAAAVVAGGKEFTRWLALLGLVMVVWG